MPDGQHPLQIRGRARPLDDDVRSWIREVAAAEEAGSGRRPFSEGLRAALQGRDDAADWLWLDPPGRACAGMQHGLTAPLVEIAAEPGSPTAGPELLRRLTAELPGGLLWTHGDRSGGRRSAEDVGLSQLRELWLMVCDPSTAGIAAGNAAAEGIVLRDFDPAVDIGPWLTLNREAFADLPDQASWTEADLQSRLDSDWFDPQGFIVAVRDDRLVGFHWTKVDPEAGFSGEPSGEVYVLAVAPDQRGTGLARALLHAGLEHLCARGLRSVHLFVDADNSPAIGLYETAGFRHWDSDRQYKW